jgi:two-component system chemotaxis response regulator CheY
MKVLVVDDDVVARMVLMHLVDSCGGFEIHEAEDGEDAWRQLDDGLRPAITFCDLRMPRLSGMDLLARVKADPRLASMSFVLVSAANERETMEQANGLGAGGYILKPFEAEQVRNHLMALPASNLPTDEMPAETARRLGIDMARLLLYLGGLHGQLVSASGEVAQQLAHADVDAARARLARLREGCAMLGLMDAVAGLAAVQAVALEPAGVEAALEHARQAVSRQSELARSLASGQ